MGFILFILCILFCIGVFIFILSNDSKNIIVDEDESINIRNNKQGVVEQVKKYVPEPNGRREEIYEISADTETTETPEAHETPETPEATEAPETSEVTEASAAPETSEQEQDQ